MKAAHRRTGVLSSAGVGTVRVVGDEPLVVRPRLLLAARTDYGSVCGCPMGPWTIGFSLRTLLIVTTLVSLMLGLVVGLASWASASSRDPSAEWICGVRFRG